MSHLLRQMGVDTRYVLLGFPLSIIGFSIVLTGFAAGVGSAVAVVGLLVLSITLAIARGFAGVERAQLPEVLGRPVAAPRYRRPAAGTNAFRRTIGRLACGQSWLDLLFTIIRFPLAVASFVVVVVWWAVALNGFAFPLYGWILDRTAGHVGLPELIGLGSGLGTATAFYLSAGVVFALTLPFVLRITALLNAGLAQALLAPVGVDPAEPVVPAEPVHPFGPVGYGHGGYGGPVGYGTGYDAGNGAGNGAAHGVAAPAGYSGQPV